MRIGLNSDILVLMVVIGEEKRKYPQNWLSIGITVRRIPVDIVEYVRIVGGS
jgi:hypothetical protein